MKDEELMQQALEALEGLTEKVSRTGFADSGAYTNALDAVDLMRERLAQPEREPLDRCEDCGMTYCECGERK